MKGSSIDNPQFVGQALGNADEQLLVHDSLLREREQHTPEGTSPDRKTTRWEVRLLAPVVVLALIAGGVVAYRFVGWVGAVVGGILLVVYLAWGAGPELIASVLRRQEHRRLEGEVQRDLAESRGESG